VKNSCCEHRNKPSGSMKCLENSGVVAQLAAFREGLSSVNFVKD
jgi:hypothetical protein